MDLRKIKGLADWAFIAIICGIMTVIGTVIPAMTKTPDTPVEQFAEKVIKLETGQEVDFSAHLKKQEDGRVVATDVKAKTTKAPTNVNPDFPVSYSK